MQFNGLLYSYTEIYQGLWRVSDTELYSIFGEYMSAMLHSIKVKTPHNIIQKQIPYKNQNYCGKKNFESEIFLSPPCKLEIILSSWMDKL